MTQKDRVLLQLRMRPEGLCVSDVANDLAYTLRNRVSELRHAGVPIASEPCKAHRHRAAVSRYRLAPNEQLAIAL